MLDSDLSPFVPNPKQARSRQTVLDILEAAAELFATRGYDQISTSDIATHAGKPVGSVYTYFRDKQQVLLAVWDLLYRHEAEAALAELELVPGGDLRGVIDNAITRLFERQTLYRRLSPTIAYVALQDAEVAARVRDLNRTVLDRIHGFLRTLDDHGLANIPDPEAAALVLQVSAETLAGMGLPYTGQISRERVKAMLSEVIWRFIVGG